MRRTACVFLALSALMAAMPPASAQSPAKKPLLEPRHDAWARGVLDSPAAPARTDPRPIPLPPPRPSGHARAGPPVPALRPARAPAGKAIAAKDAGPELGACQAVLAKLGVRYSRLPARSASRGCRVPRPLSLSRAAAGVSLTPAAILNCHMAQALARWTAKALVPAARKYLARRVSGLSVAASYVCRRQASGRKMSEHAFANAIDIKAVSFADGTIYRVGQRAASSGQRRFAAEIRRKACAYFTTVLGPGADADHHDHFHFDLRGRRGGYRLCQ